MLLAALVGDEAVWPSAAPLATSQPAKRENKVRFFTEGESLDWGCGGLGGSSGVVTFAGGGACKGTRRVIAIAFVRASWRARSGVCRNIVSAASIGVNSPRM